MMTQDDIAALRKAADHYSWGFEWVDSDMLEFRFRDYEGDLVWQGTTEEGHPSKFEIKYLSLALPQNIVELIDRLTDAEKRASLLRAALVQIGIRIQNDRGEWKVRKPHSDMPQVVEQINAALKATVQARE